jgi:hypothetical protein
MTPFSEDIQMRKHESPNSISSVARSLALVAAFLVSSAALSQRVAAQDTSAPPASRNDADTARAYEAPSSVWYAQRVRRVIGDGTHVELTDGTIWEVYLPNRPSVDTWRPGDLLIMREAAVMQGEYDCTMQDGRTRRLVWARLVGDVSSRS